MRNTHKLGDNLSVDDLTGFVHYASEMRKTWDGLIVHKDVYEHHIRNPQEFVKARREVDVVANPRAPAPLDQSCSLVPAYIGNTTILTPILGNAARYLAKGVGSMSIGCDFVVR